MKLIDCFMYFDEDLVLDIVEKFKSKYDVEIKNFELQKETVSFNLPKNIRR